MEALDGIIKHLLESLESRESQFRNLAGVHVVRVAFPFLLAAPVTVFKIEKIMQMKCSMKCLAENKESFFYSLVFIWVGWIFGLQHSHDLRPVSHSA